MAESIACGSAGVTHAEMANAIRALAMDAVEAAKSGHPGMPMGMADVATVLFTQHLRYDAAAPDWQNRDRFILSAGHGSMLLYALLYLTGYPGMDLDQIQNFRQLGSVTAGHPEYGHAAGIETTTGPLGQGLANAVGFAIAERRWNALLGDELINHHTFALAGDGCLMEGISQEAITLAGHLKLGRLIVLFDDNGISIDGSTALSTSDDQVERFHAAGWNTVSIDGHDANAIDAALTRARADDSKPWLIACKTTIGYGSPQKAGTAGVHGSPLGAEEIEATRSALEWRHAPFEIPQQVLMSWRHAGARAEAERTEWTKAWERAPAHVREAFANPVGGSVDPALSEAVAAAKSEAAAATSTAATRVWSQRALGHLVPAVPALIGGSADLTGSNNTKTSDLDILTANNYAGRYIHYGIREHGMAAAMNGLALYGGLVPYGGTFLVFSDYCRPALRLSALMKQRVVFVLTHDSIGLGEDGPTHQPIEHLASLRAIPNLQVFRPCDGVETAECWELAIRSANAPSVLALTRQNVTNIRREAGSHNLSACGAYVLVEPDGDRDVTLLATGSEVGIALDAASSLSESGIRTAVVSVPSMELFRKQSVEYRAEVLGKAPRVGIEAGISMCWHEWIGPNGAFVGLSDFGASAPAGKLFEHFGLTSDRVVATAHEVISSHKA